MATARRSILERQAAQGFPVRGVRCVQIPQRKATRVNTDKKDQCRTAYRFCQKIEIDFETRSNLQMLRISGFRRIEKSISTRPLFRIQGKLE
ncbi:hypothetical protein M0D69_33330 [Caballeronia sp. SEWSISQ10-4 2]|uniref:hypothetical protein n=1 Tax=Caballeronia sp. SEWSISQ10-4 2 TaxID=2937438 RepID=UPI00264A912F|nr:hypothetical protein [Caballeronia sp. SEWSISQ10-4 2]MDN7182816.1 hypothetical protein [Caballeronia sp. SEWSISQ10-4 2]